VQTSAQRCKLARVNRPTQQQRNGHVQAIVDSPSGLKHVYR